MLKLREIDVGLNSMLIAFQMKEFLLARAPEMTINHGRYFKVSRSCMRGWVQERLGWSFRKPTNNASKLSANWQDQGELLLYKLAYYVVAYCIPTSLVVNAD